MRFPARRTLPSSTLVTPRVSAILRMSVFCPWKAKAEVRAMTLRSGDLTRSVDDFLGQAVAEIFVVRVTAHVGERQHGDGRLRLSSDLTPPIQCGLQVPPSIQTGPPRAWPCNGGRSRASSSGRIERRRLVVEDRAHQSRRCDVAAEGTPAAQHLVEHRAKGEDVGALVEQCLPCACSGDMYAAVPRTVPSNVRVTSASSDINLARPKSSSLTIAGRGPGCWRV